MTPNQAYQAAQNVLVKIARLDEMKKELDKEYADLIRIAHGDNRHDAHNATEMQKDIDRRIQMDLYWSEEAKAKRSADQQADQAREHALLADQRRQADAEWQRIQDMRQRIR